MNRRVAIEEQLTQINGSWTAKVDIEKFE